MSTNRPPATPQRLLHAAFRSLSRAPEGVSRALLRPIPRNDRDAELDLATFAMLELLRVARLDRLETVPAEQAARRANPGMALLDLPIDERVRCEDFELPGPGGPLPSRSYAPPTHDAATGPLLLWLHGGGFMIGDLETHAGVCSMLAARASCTVVAVDSRTAPRHPFPAAVDDALASFRWLREHAERFGGEPGRVSVGGDSAGANLAAVVCHQLRDAGEAQPPLQVLVYPTTSSLHDFPSVQRFAKGLYLSEPTLAYFTDHYLPQHEDRVDPRASPLLTERFDGLAPAIVHTAGFDPLRDEGEAYVERLREAGVAVAHRSHERLVHGYFGMGGLLPAAREAVYDLGDELRLRLHEHPA